MTALKQGGSRVFIPSWLAKKKDRIVSFERKFLKSWTDQIECFCCVITIYIFAKVSHAAVALVLFPPVLRKPRGFFPIDQSECVNFVYLRHKGTCDLQGWCKQRSAKWDPNRFLERRTSHIFPLYVIYKSLYQPKLESWLRKSILNQVVKTMLQGVCGFLVTVLWFGNPIFLSNTALSAISMDSSGDFIREALGIVVIPKR